MASQAYFATDGVEADFYDCIDAAAAGESPATNPEKWRRIEIPAVYEWFLVSRAASLLLPGEGQSDKARAEEVASAKTLDYALYRERNARCGRMRKPKVFTR